MISFESKVTVPAHVMVRVLDREAVLLNIETEKYFGLDEVGTRMWQLTTTAANVEAAYQALLAEYDVEPAQLRQNLGDLLEKLSAAGLLKAAPSDVGTASAI
jgi:DNA integrity scanning protein DisA with diadenylate cyclase activity